VGTTKRKKQLKFKKTIENLSGRYVVTKVKVTKWFNKLNELLFDNVLEDFDGIKVRCITGQVGACVEYENEKTGIKTYKLEINPTFRNFKSFASTLAHEMVHLYQMKVKNDSGNHNKMFYSFKPKMETLKLQLSRTV